jgi:hypothetical protein
VVLWETLVGERLFPGGVRPDLVSGTPGAIPSPRERGAVIDAALDAIVMRALAGDPAQRFETAQQMAEQLAAFPLASREEIADWVQSTVGEDLDKRARLIARIEAADASIFPPPSEQRPGARYFAGLGSGEGTLATASGTTPRRSVPRPFRARGLMLAAALAGLAGAATALWSHSGSTPGQVQAFSPGVPLAPAAPSPPGVPPLAGTPLEGRRDQPFGIVGDDPASELAPTDSLGARQRTRGATAAAPRREHARPRGARGAAAASRTGPPVPAKAGCTPPYTVDEAGRRHYKPECF